MNIHFEKISQKHKETIFQWLEEAHVKEFWDNSQDHKDDILNFIEGRKIPSTYCDGLYVYWIAKINSEPYALIMTIQEKPEYDIAPLKKIYLSKTGHTYGLDFMIGNKSYFSKGLGAPTLVKFMDFFRKEVDPKADTFLIDPEESNPRARRVYEKAGFEYMGDFIGFISKSNTHLLVKKFIGHKVK